MLEDRGIAGRVDAVAGTSACAITAALVAAGYSAAELKTTMMALDLRSFEDGRLEGPARILEHYGWYKGDAFLAWLRARLADKLTSADVTFSELQQARQVDLRVVATDVSTHRPVTFSAALSPHVAVAEAVPHVDVDPAVLRCRPVRGKHVRRRRRGVELPDRDVRRAERCHPRDPRPSPRPGAGAAVKATAFLDRFEGAADIPRP